MKKAIFLALFVFSGGLYSQTITFLRNFNENLFSVIQDSNNYLATSSSSVYQLDEYGFVEWENNLLNGELADFSKPVKVNLGDYIVGAGSGNKTYFIRYSSSGEERLRGEYSGGGFADISMSGMIIISQGGSPCMCRVDRKH